MTESDPTPPTTAALLASIHDRWLLRPDEEIIVRQVEALLDLAGRLQEAIDSEGVTVKGSNYQPRQHPALSELRAAREGASRLLRGLHLPDDQGWQAGATERSVNARKAARARWSRGGPGTSRRRPRGNDESA